MLVEQVVQWFISSRLRGDSGSGARKAARPATIAYYLETLEHFKAFLDEKGITDFAQVTRHTVYDYVTAVKSKNWSVATQNKTFRALRAFLRFVELDEDCQEAGLRPLRKALPTIPKSVSKPNIPSKADFQRMFAAVNTKKRSGHRDFTIMSLLLETGMRIGEVCLLTVDSAKLEDRHVIVPEGGKTGTRLVPITPSMCRLLRAWLKRRASFAKCDRLFVTDAGDPIHVKAIGMEFRRLCSRAGIPTISPHAFRHAFCTYYLERGGDMAKLRRITGHSSYDMLENYLHLSTASLEAEHEKMNPREALFSKNANFFNKSA